MIVWLILSFILFIFLSTFIFFIPGLLALKVTKIKFSKIENIFLAGVLGYILITFLLYLSLFIKNFYYLSFVIMLANFYYFYKFPLNLKTLIPKKISFIIISIFLIGILGQLAIIAPSGSLINGDLVFWSAHGHDGLWHIALIEQLKNGYPIQNPIFANTKLVNYHFFSDLTSAYFSQTFNLNSLDLFFKFFPFLYSLYLGIGIYTVTLKLAKNLSAKWALFFTYFSGSFGYFVTFFRDGKLSGETIFWSSQIQSSSGNPPQIASLVLILAIFYLLLIYLENPKHIFFPYLIAPISMLVEFKVYAAIVLFLTLGILSLTRILKDHKFDLTLITLTSAIFSILIFLPNSSNVSGFLIWEPGWYLRTMVVSSDKLNWIDQELRRQTYLYERNYKRVIQLELTWFLIFLVGNLGTKILGIWQIKNLIKQVVSYSSQFLLLISFFSLLLPMLFLQKGVAGNSIQFLQYFLLFFSILAGITTATIFNKIKNLLLKIIFSLIIILLSIPSQIGLIKDFYSRPPFAKISNSELQALNYINQTTDKNSQILSSEFNKYYNTHLATPPIWAWSDTAYISAISKRAEFISDTEQLDIMGYDFKERRSIQIDIFTTAENSKFQNLLKQNKINYLYITQKLYPKINLSETGLTKVYQNKEVEIWQVN